MFVHEVVRNEYELVVIVHEVVRIDHDLVLETQDV